MLLSMLPDGVPASLGAVLLRFSWTRVDERPRTVDRSEALLDYPHIPRWCQPLVPQPGRSCCRRRRAVSGWCSAFPRWHFGAITP